MQKLQNYAELFRQPGPWCTVYVNVSTGTVDSLEATDVLGDHVRDRLAAAGATKDDAAAAAQLTWAAKGTPAPVSRFVLIRGGEVVLNELLQGRPGAEQISCGPIPDLLPFLRNRGDSFPYVVAAVDRVGGEIRLHRAELSAPLESANVTGSAEDIKKVPSGGWSQGRYQHRTEEIWRRNADSVAAEMATVASTHGARLIVLAGDIRARDMVKSQLPQATASITRVVDMEPRSADDPELAPHVERELAEMIAWQQQDLLNTLAERSTRAQPLATTGWGAVITALQQAQVETLLINTAELDGRELFVLDQSPWLATESEQALDAGILGKVAAGPALVRAAALTDARLDLLAPGALPHGAVVAALLRWPSGPSVPTENPSANSAATE